MIPFRHYRLNLLKGALRPESSVLPAKKPHISPAASKYDNTFIVDCQPADLTYSKCPKHLSTTISSKLTRKEATTTTLKTFCLKWRQSRLRKESNEETVVMWDDYHLSGEISKPQHGWQSNLGRKRVADRQHCECCSNDASDQFSMTTGFQSTNAGLCMTFTIEPD